MLIQVKLSIKKVTMENNVINSTNNGFHFESSSIVESFDESSLNENASLTIVRNQIADSVGLNGANNRGDVEVIQKWLKKLGYEVTTNGIIVNSQSDATIAAIFNFQTNASLTITGNIFPNDATFQLLKLKSTSVSSITEGDEESLHQPFVTNSFFFRNNAGNPGTLNVFFEGDSWLDYPIPRVLDLYDTITQRNQRLNLNCLHLAKFGETTSDMIRDRSNFVQYISRYRIDRIYFSGGGNDVFPNLGRIINSGTTTFNNSFFTDQTKLSELRTLSGDELNRRCVQYKNHLNVSVFDAALFNSFNLNSIFSVIRNNYLQFGHIMNTHGTPNLIFYMHTYDYPMYKLGVQPSLGVTLPIGPWIKPVFDRMGISDPILRNYIIIRLLDKFYALLRNIAYLFNAHGYRFQTRIIDYRGLLNSSEYWRDEIHPNSAGASRLATRVNF